jgi:hypothetical protein
MTGDFGYQTTLLLMFAKPQIITAPARFLDVSQFIVSFFLTEAHLAWLGHYERMFIGIGADCSQKNAGSQTKPGRQFTPQSVESAELLWLLRWQALLLV